MALRSSGLNRGICGLVVGSGASRGSWSARRDACAPEYVVAWRAPIRASAKARWWRRQCRRSGSCHSRRCCAEYRTAVGATATPMGARLPGVVGNCSDSGWRADRPALADDQLHVLRRGRLPTLSGASGNQRACAFAARDALARTALLPERVVHQLPGVGPGPGGPLSSSSHPGARPAPVSVAGRYANLTSRC